MNLSEAVTSSSPNLVNANKANPSKVNPFIAMRPRKKDHFSKTSNENHENHDVTVSIIITWADHFKEKANEVNDYLSKHCMERNIYLIDHSKTMKNQHLNGSKLHLNKRDAPILQKTLYKFLSNTFNWLFEENHVEIATVSSTALQSDKECSKSKANQTANAENASVDSKPLCLKNFNKLIISHLNINSLRKKFEFLISLIKDNLDILMISEWKLDQSLPTNQFMINGFSAPFCLDRND